MFFRIYFKNEFGSHIGMDNKTKVLHENEKIYLNTTSGLIFHSHPGGEQEVYPCSQVFGKRIYLADTPPILDDKLFEQVSFHPKKEEKSVPALGILHSAKDFAKIDDKNKKIKK